MLANVLT